MEFYNELGKNLSFVINCKYLYAYDWMSYLCWYSMQKYAPDAEIYIKLEKKGIYFHWADKLRVNFYKKPNKEFIFVEPTSILIRDLMNFDNFSDICCKVKEDKFLCFVDYSYCGNFVLDDWINTSECPLSYIDRFMTTDINSNELKALQLMKQAYNSYRIVSNGGR